MFSLKILTNVGKDIEENKNFQNPITWEELSFMFYNIYSSSIFANMYICLLF